VPEPPARPRDCPGFARFWTAATVSSFGSYVTGVAVQVLIVRNLHQGAAGVGAVNAARWLPYLLFGLLVGALVERSRRRPLLIGADLGRGVLLAAVPVLAATGGLTLEVLMGLMAGFGLLSLVGDAAFQSYLPRLVPTYLLTRANARLDQSDAAAQTSGPALAGGLVAVLGAPVAVLVDAASYLASGLLLVRLPATEPARQRSSIRQLPSEISEGLRWIYRHHTLRPLALATHGSFLCYAATGAVLAPFALRTLQLSALGFGLVLAMAGVGAVLGSLVAAGLGSRFGAGRVIIAGRAGTAAAWAVAALSPANPAGWVVLSAAQLLVGLSMGAENANEMGYRQAVTPDRLQGRTNTTMRSINRAMVVAGAPVAGLLADSLGYRPVLAAASVGFLLAAAAMAVSPVAGTRIPDQQLK
jgi:MFS family permease